MYIINFPGLLIEQLFIFHEGFQLSEINKAVMVFIEKGEFMLKFNDILISCWH